MTESILAVIVVVIAVGLAMWRPTIAVMTLGVFLFVQSALVRLDGLPNQVSSMLARADEIMLAALLVRAAFDWWRQGRPPFPTALWALVVFAVIGVASALLNGVSPLAMGLGIYLAAKAGLWLFVGWQLRVDTRVLARYGYLIGALFIGVVGVALLQVLGVPLPWEPRTRGGVFAATSIWNFHTAFGGALSVAVGLSVVAFRLPGERLSAAVLAVFSVAGVLLSTARRLLASLTVAGVATVFALPAEGRRQLRSLVGMARRPAVLAVLVLGVGIAAVVVGPRLVNLAELTWDRYVVNLTNRDRYLLYEGAFRLVQESPVLGRGPATYGSYASVLVDSPAYSEVGYDRPRAAMVVGGQLASVVAEYGILGFAAFATFVVLLVRALLPISRGPIGTIRAALATGGIFMIVNMVVESTVNPVFSNSFITFFTFVGIGIALRFQATPSTVPDEAMADAWTPQLVDRTWRLASLAAAFVLLAALGVLIAVTIAV